MGERIAKENEVDNVFHISHRAEKSLDLQVCNLGKEHLNINESKRERLEHFKESNEGKITAHERGQNSVIHSWAEWHKFKSNIQTFAHFCKAEFNVKDINNITPNMAVSFCNALSDLGYAKNSVNGYLSTIEKMGAFLGKDFHADLQSYKKTESYKSLEAKDMGTRAYADPQKIIDSLTNEKAQFSAQLSLNYGLRISDACHFRLNGNEIAFNSKNGMKTVKILSPADTARAARLVDGNGKYNLSVNTMKDCWGRACASAGAANTGVHGLRHNFAQNLYNSLRDKGLSHKSACRVTSHEMNHSREKITERYLR